MKPNVSAIDIGDYKRNTDVFQKHPYNPFDKTDPWWFVDDIGMEPVVCGRVCLFAIRRGKSFVTRAELHPNETVEMVMRCLVVAMGLESIRIISDLEYHAVKRKVQLI